MNSQMKVRMFRSISYFFVLKSYGILNRVYYVSAIDATSAEMQISIGFSSLELWLSSYGPSTTRKTLLCRAAKYMDLCDDIQVVAQKYGNVLSGITADRWVASHLGRYVSTVAFRELEIPSGIPVQVDASVSGD